MTADLTVSAEDGDVLIHALQIMREHALAIRESGHPQGVEASEALARSIIPFAETVMSMQECGIIRPPGETIQELMDLLHPDPWRV